MKRILFIVMLLIIGNLNAQWKYKLVKDWENFRYRLAYTPECNGATAYMLYLDSAVVLEILGGSYCDKEPIIDVVLVVKGVANKFKFQGYKGDGSDVVYITWNMELHPAFLKAFRRAKKMKIKINETQCESSIYKFKMSKSNEAFQYIRNSKNK